MIDFPITPKGPVGVRFFTLGIKTFKEATLWIRQLPFRRNSDKADPFCLFRDECGTCGTRHALLRNLAEEEGFTEVMLMLGIYRMSGRTNTSVAPVLASWGLDYIPEAHNYIRHGDAVLDVTFPGKENLAFTGELMYEREIGTGQIGSWKVEMHKIFLETWVRQEGIKLSAAEAWQAREDCIAALGL